MLKFYPATITSKTSETADSLLITLAVPDEVSEAFRYSHGQHLAVRATIDGNDLRRTYSICTSVSDQILRLGIRLQGVFSNYIAEQLKVGDTLEVMPPSGHFQTRLAPDQSKTYAAFVAGSGITPLLSIIKTTLETEADSRFVLFYGNRKRSTTMFINELSDLKNLYPERLALHFIMSREKDDMDIYTGRIDSTKAKKLEASFLKHSRPDDIFICGPNPMIDDVKAALIELKYDPERIHTEHFQTEPASVDAAIQSQESDGQGARVTVIIDGNQQSFQMRDDSLTLLEAAEENDLDLPFACKSGVCSTCRCLLSKGKVTMANNSALEDWEVEEGFILVCQARPETDEIEIDYDQA